MGIRKNAGDFAENDDDGGKVAQLSGRQGCQGHSWFWMSAILGILMVLDCNFPRFFKVNFFYIYKLQGCVAFLRLDLLLAVVVLV